MEIKLDPQQAKDIIAAIREDLKKELKATAPPPVLLSTKLAMQRLGMKDHHSFLRWVQQSKIKSQKIGQTTYYNEQDLPVCRA
jgi:3-hydroxyacyl-CoA dehydrogenase